MRATAEVPRRLRLLMFPLMFALGLGLALACCGSTPAAPSPSAAVTAAPLPDGAYILNVLGDSIGCADVKSPQAGTSVWVVMAATHQADGTWIAHPSTPAGGAFELRLAKSDGTVPAPSGPAGPLDTVVAGTLSGVAIDSFQLTALAKPSESSAVFGTGVTVRGIVRAGGLSVFADGLVMDTMSFAGNAVSSTCAAGAVAWSLNRRQ